jgi:copper chaperone CopZ
MKSRIFSLLTVSLTFLLFGFNSTAQTAKALAQTDTATQNLKKLKFKVSGITCSGDCKDIEKVVSEINGVTECKTVSKPTATTVFEVTFNPTIVSESEIKKAVEGTPGCDDPNERPYKYKKG